MAADVTSGDDILRLNALIDGELPPAEHAALATRLAADRELARAHATLARLKACVVETATEAPPVLPAPAPRPRRRRAVTWVAAAAVLAIASLVVVADVPPHRRPVVTALPAPVIVLASLTNRPTIPDLSAAGLRLASLTVTSDGATPHAVAVYLGPRGCRLDLRVEPAAAAGRRDEPGLRVWTVGEVAYRLGASGMPAGRFAVIADAAERATAGAALPAPLEFRLREARLAAPPCVG